MTHVYLLMRFDLMTSRMTVSVHSTLEGAQSVVPACESVPWVPSKRHADTWQYGDGLVPSEIIRKLEIHP